jgi:hypothetical protein
MKAASYVAGGQDWDTMFKFYDRDNEGTLGKDEFLSACRRDGKISAQQVSDNELFLLFNFVDKDLSGVITIEEFAAFLTEPLDLVALEHWAREEVRMEAERKKAARKAKADADLANRLRQEAEAELARVRAEMERLENLRLATLVEKEALEAERLRLLGENKQLGVDCAQSREKERQWQEDAIKRMQISTREKMARIAYGIWKELWHTQVVEKRAAAKMADMEKTMAAQLQSGQSEAQAEVARQSAAAADSAVYAAQMAAKQSEEAARRSAAEVEARQREEMLRDAEKVAEAKMQRALQEKADVELELVGAREELRSALDDVAEEKRKTMIAEIKASNEQQANESLTVRTSTAEKGQKAATELAEHAGIKMERAAKDAELAVKEADEAEAARASAEKKLRDALIRSELLQQAKLEADRAGVLLAHKLKEEQEARADAEGSSVESTDALAAAQAGIKERHQELSNALMQTQSRQGTANALLEEAQSMYDKSQMMVNAQSRRIDLYQSSLTEAEHRIVQLERSLNSSRHAARTERHTSPRSCCAECGKRLVTSPRAGSNRGDLSNNRGDLSSRGDLSPLPAIGAGAGAGGDAGGEHFRSREKNFPAAGAAALGAAPGGPTTKGGSKRPPAGGAGAPKRAPAGDAAATGSSGTSRTPTSAGAESGPGAGGASASFGNRAEGGVAGGGAGGGAGASSIDGETADGNTGKVTGKAAVKAGKASGKVGKGGKAGGRTGSSVKPPGAGTRAAAAARSRGNEASSRSKSPPVACSKSPPVVSGNSPPRAVGRTVSIDTMTQGELEEKYSYPEPGRSATGSNTFGPASGAGAGPGNGVDAAVEPGTGAVTGSGVGTSAESGANAGSGSGADAGSGTGAASASAASAGAADDAMARWATDGGSLHVVANADGSPGSVVKPTGRLDLVGMGNPRGRSRSPPQSRGSRGGASRGSPRGTASIYATTPISPGNAVKERTRSRGSRGRGGKNRRSAGRPGLVQTAPDFQCPPPPRQPESAPPHRPYECAVITPRLVRSAPTSYSERLERLERLELADWQPPPGSALPPLFDADADLDAYVSAEPGVASAQEPRRGGLVRPVGSQHSCCTGHTVKAQMALMRKAPSLSFLNVLSSQERAHYLRPRAPPQRAAAIADSPWPGLRAQG